MPYRNRNSKSLSGCLTAVVMVIGIVMLALGACIFYLVSTEKIVDWLPLLDGIVPKEMLERYEQVDSVQELETTLTPRSFAAYSWDEIVAIARRIENAPDEAQALSIAKTYNLLDSQGHITKDVLLAQLDDGTIFDVRIAGILHDEKSDGSGRAALTFIAGVLSKHEINQEASSVGGWQSSEIRSWLSSDVYNSLPETLVNNIVRVNKLTNNYGGLDMNEFYAHSLDEIVTTTDDSLWLFSAKEVCGESGWFVGEYRSGYFESDNFEAILNAEGEQYQLFKENGVTMDSDPLATLQFSYKGSLSPWWYRSCHPFSMHDTREDDLFYQVMSNGYPYSLASCDSSSGVVVGFCI